MPSPEKKTAGPVPPAVAAAPLASPSEVSGLSAPAAPADAAGGRGNRPWYLSAQALYVIANIRRRPPVEWKRKTYVLTTDEWGEFTGPKIEALDKVFTAEWHRREHDDAHRRRLFDEGTPEDVIGALWGDPNGNEHFITHRDESAKWETIRRNVDDALRGRRGGVKPFVSYLLRHGPSPEPVPECTPTFTLDRETGRAKREMGAKRWAELNAEWERG